MQLHRVRLCDVMSLEDNGASLVRNYKEARIAKDTIKKI